jgi:hypothetical protein
MRVKSVPGRYRSVLAAGVNAIVEQIELDIYRREHGLKPLIEDFMICPEPAADAIVAIDSVVVVADADVPIADAVRRAREVAREERRIRGKRTA